MADEGLATGLIQATKGGASVRRDDSVKFTVDGNNLVQQTQLIDNAAGTTISLGAITLPPSYIRVKNMDAVNTVHLATDLAMANKFAAIGPSQFALWPPYAASIFGQATTTASRVEIVAADS